MSLTSYRAAPPRDGVVLAVARYDACRCMVRQGNGFLRSFHHAVRAPATMPGDDLLFPRLSDSTIGAVGFHGRVRDGIGWVTDAIATKQ